MSDKEIHLRRWRRRIQGKALNFGQQGRERVEEHLVFNKVVVAWHRALTRNTSFRTATPRIWFLPQFQTIRLQSACGRCRNTPSLKKRDHQISSSLKQPFGVPKLLDDTGSPAPLCQAGVALLDNGYVGYVSFFVGSCPKRNTNESIVLSFKWQTNFNVDVLWNGKTT